MEHHSNMEPLEIREVRGHTMDELEKLDPDPATCNADAQHVLQWSLEVLQPTVPCCQESISHFDCETNEIIWSETQSKINLYSVDF